MALCFTSYHTCYFPTELKVHTELVKYITRLETNNMEFNYTRISKSFLKYNYKLLITT